eukprot:GILK01004741.1.p1 GENE.GILK01004741.1~~GILK01004741.1.p1  ORF type:complete len:402 (+),score=70.84 GILK01004741.1:58-1206(+)
MDELKELVVHTLEANGVLASLRAQLRANVYKAIEQQEKAKGKSEPGFHFENPLAQKINQTPQGRIAAELVREFLQFFRLDYSLSVFLPESNLTPNPKEVDGLASEIGLPKSSLRTQPLLLELISMLHSNGMPATTKATSPPTTTTTVPPAASPKTSPTHSAPLATVPVPLTTPTATAPPPAAAVTAAVMTATSTAVSPSTSTPSGAGSSSIASPLTSLPAPIPKSKLEPLGSLPPLKGKSALPPLTNPAAGGKKPTFDVDASESEAERKKLAEIEKKIAEIEKKDATGSLKLIREVKTPSTAMDSQDNYDDQEDFENDSDIEEEIEFEQSLESSEGPTSPHGRKMQESLSTSGINDSMGIDQSVDSLALEEYDHIEQVEDVI